MKLFDDSDLINPNKNWLPYDGIVHYYGELLSRGDADYYFNRLFKTVEWEHDILIIFGKKIITKRKIAWYGDESFSYTYSNTTKHALPWTRELSALKKIVEIKSGEQYNSCLCNLYHSGEEGMSWHTDNEKELKSGGAIASLSLGAQRKFSFKHKKSKETISFDLENGSLLMMKGTIQEHWLHSLPKSKKIKDPRINLTFRSISKD